MATLRTFIAVDSAPHIRSRAADLVSRLSLAPDKVRWIEPQNLHWTLKFLGDVDDVAIAEVCRRVQEAVRSLEPFTIEVCGAGAFPRPDRPRTLWLGVRQGQEQMTALQAPIEHALAEMGFHQETRRFVPHLTIGRVTRTSSDGQELGELLAKNADFPAGTMEVDEVVVYSSRLTRDGPEYEPLGRGPLEG
ncbi:MAG: RNA 2',3'-cyclic phosphodiesterase [Pirellulales bacterium]